MIKLLLTLTLVLNLTAAFAKVRVSEIDSVSKGSEGIELIVKFNGAFENKPELTIRDNIVQVSMTGAVVWPQIEKKITVEQDKQATMLAYQFDKNTVRFRTVMPYSVAGIAESIKYDIANGVIKLTVPTVVNSDGISGKPGKIVKASDFDESYLNKLIDDKKIAAVKKNDFQEEFKVAQNPQQDEIKVKQSAGKKEDAFAFGTYVAKFGFFLGIVLLLFYGVVNVFKKGVLKKGKMGMFENLQTISVLNTTYLGPKKQLHLVKAHKQVFLIAADDKGIHYLSEIRDINGLIKESEKEVVGSNFDTSLNVANLSEKEFRLKTMINASEEQYLQDQPVEELSKFLEKKESKPKLADQIKSKVKNLKPLQ